MGGGGDARPTLPAGGVKKKFDDDEDLIEILTMLALEEQTWLIA